MGEDGLAAIKREGNAVKQHLFSSRPNIRKRPVFKAKNVKKREMVLYMHATYECRVMEQ